MRLASLFVDIVGDQSRLSSALGQARSSMSGFAGWAKSLGIGQALMGEIKDSLSTAANIESLMINLGNAAGASSPEVAKLKEEVFHLSREIRGVSVEGLIDIETVAAKAGIATENLSEFTRGAAKLSAATTEMDPGNIVESLVNMNSSLKLSQQEMINLGSAVIKLADSGTASVPKIFNVSSRIAGAGKAAGLNAPEILALSAAMLETGARAEQSSGSLVRFMGALASEEGITSYAKRFGISGDEAKMEIETSPLEAQMRFLGSLKGQTLGEVIKAFNDLGMEGKEDAAVLTNLSSKLDTIRRYSGLAADEIRTGAKANESYEKRAESANARAMAFANSMTVLKEKMGEALGPGFANILDNLTKLMDKLSAAEGKFKAIETVATATSKAVTDFFQGDASGKEPTSVTSPIPTRLGPMAQYATATAAEGYMSVAEKIPFLGSIPTSDFAKNLQESLGFPTWEGLKDTFRGMKEDAETRMVPASVVSAGQALDAKLKKQKEEEEERKRVKADEAYEQLLDYQYEMNEEPARKRLEMKRRHAQAEEDLDNDARRILDPAGHMRDTYGNKGAFYDPLDPESAYAYADRLKFGAEGEHQQAWDDYEEGKKKKLREVSVQGFEDRLKAVQEGVGKDEIPKELKKLQEKSNEFLKEMNENLKELKKNPQLAARLGR